ncbi:hypothetical protein O1L60_26135 [Streptomyces diastatochromogenes]|nr:hypothetical protein [Streptomyces diastatochromogenes]
MLLEIDTPRWGRRYPWRVKLLRDGHMVTLLHGDDQGVERAQLKKTLRGPLAEALRLGDNGPHLASVEAVLPHELFDEPLDTWRLDPPKGPDEEWGPPPSDSAASWSSGTPGARAGTVARVAGALGGGERGPLRAARCAPRCSARARTPTPRACAGRARRRRASGSAGSRAAPFPSTAGQWAAATGSRR